MTALEKLKLKLGETTISDDRLNLFLEAAEDSILDIIGREELPQRLESVKVELAVIAVNRLGTEGESSRSEGGISSSFIDGLPEDMRLRLRNYPRKAGVIHDEVD